MRRYIVSHSLKIAESCVVEARSKAEAIRKAKAGQFAGGDDDTSWEPGGYLRSYEDYDAHTDEGGA